jgi:hypothetical protein
VESGERVVIERGAICDRKLEAMVVVMRCAIMISAIVWLRVVIVIVMVIMVMIVRMEIGANLTGQMDVFAQGSRCHACENAEGEG